MPLPMLRSAPKPRCLRLPAAPEEPHHQAVQHRVAASAEGAVDGQDGRHCHRGRRGVRVVLREAGQEGVQEESGVQ